MDDNENEITLEQLQGGIRSFLDEMEKELAAMEAEEVLDDLDSTDDDLALREEDLAPVKNDDEPILYDAEIDEIVSQAMKDVAAEEAEKSKKLAHAYKFLDGTINWDKTRDSIIDDLFTLADVAPGKPLYNLDIPEKRALLTLYAEELGVNYPNDWFLAKRVVKVTKPRSA